MEALIARQGINGLRSSKAAEAVAAKLSRRTETHARSFAKAVSWRATGSIDTFIVAFVVTGSPKIAGSVAVTEGLTKILIYYAHERVWSWRRGATNDSQRARPLRLTMSSSVTRSSTSDMASRTLVISKRTLQLLTFLQSRHG